jgi:hypothetical protein
LKIYKLPIYRRSLYSYKWYKQLIVTNTSILLKKLFNVTHRPRIDFGFIFTNNVFYEKIHFFSTRNSLQVKRKRSDESMHEEPIRQIKDNADMEPHLDMSNRRFTEFVESKEDNKSKFEQYTEDNLRRIYGDVELKDFPIYKAVTDETSKKVSDVYKEHNNERSVRFYSDLTKINKENYDKSVEAMSNLNREVSRITGDSRVSELFEHERLKDQAYINEKYEQAKSDMESKLESSSELADNLVSETGPDYSNDVD